MSTEVANRLRAARKAAGLSQSQASEAWEIPLRTLQNWEANRNTPRGFALAALNAKLDAILATPPAKAAPKKKK